MTSVKTVHLIFKTHLDVGFTDLARRVVAGYRTRYIPAALQLARDLRERGGEERFVWTTGAWLIYEYLEQADRAQRRAMEQGIAASDIAWHALPFTTHTELMDADLFRFGLTLAKELDRRFGKQTIAGKMTDVPGHTRAMVPLLAEAGVEFLHIGVNSASRPPAVPPLFVWRHGDGSEVVMMYGVGYGATVGVAGLTDALHFAHTGDNAGPPTPAAVIETIGRVRERFPGATVMASTMDAFARKLRAVKAQLPVVTGELGDTWIHGVGADPVKIAQFRALSRWRKAQPDSPALRRFSRLLLLVPEHTWGLDVKTHLGDYTHYARKAFEGARRRDRVSAPVPAEFAYAAKFKAQGGTHSYSKLERSWAEQRAYITQAIGQAPAARSALREVAPRRVATTGWQAVRDRQAPLEFPGYSVRLDPVTGALVSLREKATGRDWAGPQHPLGWFRYQTFSQADYDRYLRTYNINMDHSWCGDWAIPDFSKPGMASARAPSRWWQPRLRRVWRQADRLLLELAGPSAAVRRWGCPAELTIELRFPEVEWTLQWFGKVANRLPEAMWFSFVPRVPASARWWLDKMGQLISPLDVVPDGNRKLHAVQRGVCCDVAGGCLWIESRDAPLVAPGAPALLHFDNEPLDLRGGMHFNLFNNVWGTNFPMWREDDGRFRFSWRWAAGAGKRTD